jgi:hypothetical protein
METLKYLKACPNSKKLNIFATEYFLLLIILTICNDHIQEQNKQVFVVVVVVVGPISTAAMKDYCTLTPMKFRHSSPEALHTKRLERTLLAKDGTKAKKFS